MRFTITDEIEFPRDVVYPTMRDRIEELIDYLPNVDSIEVLEREIDGDTHRYVKRWRASATEIPGLLRPIVKPEYLQWVDHATWDGAAFTTQWHHDLPFLSGALTARGLNRYIDEGDITVIELEGEFTIHPGRLTFLPGPLARKLAPALERFVVDMLKPNLRATNQAVEQWLEEQEG